ncbi:epoxide hydrolase [Rhodococcus sp. T2V]|uniref:epoxide hydrolase family protein n=1 Tax=Rhodococcus sp. T2V TaxID=3034164 RepID=UPI0023E25D71|nr:epoxide hydrolase [Rhodococcus sp. T2V]MDF3308603.1 epoxide hydrolase [Rhodococcus sp. T2V]
MTSPVPFRVDVSDEDLADLDRRLAATRFAPDIGNGDGRYGVSTERLQGLVEYWRTGYDWRAQESALNQLPMFRVDIDGQPIHYVHVRGIGPDPTPLLLTHGFPWTFWDFHRMIGPLTDPASFGGDPADAFDVVIPSLPGFAFSSPLSRAGVNFVTTADLWVRLMRDVLGYKRFAAHGGDWGAQVTAQLGHKYVDHVLGIHLTSLISFPAGWNSDRPWNLLQKAADAAAPENRAAVVAWEKRRVGHLVPQIVHPQTIAHGMNDSPAGLLAWLTERRLAWMDPAQPLEDVFPPDFLITSTMLYWITQSYPSAARFYYEAATHPWQPDHDRTPAIQAPAGLSIFRDDNPPGASFDWLPAMYAEIAHQRVHEVGGHFGAMERPDDVVTDIRATFRNLR